MDIKYFDDFLEAVNAAEFSYYKGEQEIMEVNDFGGYFRHNTSIIGNGRENGMRIISVSLHLTRPLNEVLGDSYESAKAVIESYITRNRQIADFYDIYFAKIPVCHMADIYGTLQNKSKKLMDSDNDESEQPNEKLLYTALKSGCSIMDMSDLSIYSI